ncbi:MAG: sensor domain-containing diguanylate cyclase [Planctomycetes bacterium]|nr:sensor domain-containing diguanylate cyclase [Planctomycetota bacterium]
MRRRGLLHTEVFFTIYGFFIVLMIGFGVLVHQMTSRTVKEQMANKCAGIAVAVATLLEQWPDNYKEFAETLDTTSPYYRRIKALMEEIRQGNRDNIIFVYTEKRVSANEMVYVLDGEPPDAKFFSPPGDIDLMNDTRHRAYDSRQVTTGGFIDTKFGPLLSAYAPIVNKESGEFLGLVGVDVSIDQFNEVMNYMVTLIVASLGIMVLMVAALLVLSSSRIEKLITIDGLTGVFNKAFFLRSLRFQARHSKKKDEPLLVFMADLDHFKDVNDTYGHQFGDLVLTAAAKAIKACLRESDVLARYGGEEFAAFLPGMTMSNAPSVLERIRKAVEDSYVHNDELNIDIHVTVSIGAAFLEMPQTLHEILEEADKALYTAKKTRNAVVFR